MSPKILLEKDKERENRVSEEKERKKEKRRKKSNGCTASFFFFLLLFESPILAVTLFKNLALIYIFLTFVPNRNLI